MIDLISALFCLWVSIIGLLLILGGGTSLAERFVRGTLRQIWRPFGFVLGRLEASLVAGLAHIWHQFEAMIAWAVSLPFRLVRWFFTWMWRAFTTP